MKWLFRWNYWLGFFGIFVMLDEVKANRPEHICIYKKWLGEDFNPNFDQDFSLIICNHLGIYEIQYLMYKYAPGFIAKSSIKSYPFIGFIAEKLDTLWIDRSDKNSRNEIFTLLKQRQSDYINKKVLSPLIVFPEGTTTNGSHILKFKIGAFDSLLPIKPIIFEPDHKSIGEGISSSVISMTYDFITFNHVFKFYELPVIYPTDYMYQNYKSIYPEKNLSNGEIYSEVAREIMCEISGNQKSDKSYNDWLNYKSIVFNTKMK